MSVDRAMSLTCNTFYVRPATESDVETILKLVLDLAIYEKSEDSVKATPDLLRQNMFRSPYAHALLAFERKNSADSDSDKAEDVPIGLALYFFNFSTWTGRPGLYLEDLFVKPEYRNKGIGKALFGELGKIAQEKNCARLDWAVLTWNQPSIDFYEKVLGATRMSEWAGMRLEEDGILGLQRFRLDDRTTTQD